MTQAENDNLVNVSANQRSAPHSRTRSEPHTSGIDEPVHPQGHPPKNLLDGMIKALRPKQQVKNVLAIAVPLAVGNEIMDSGCSISILTVDVLMALVAFCMVASSIYLINDARDVEADRVYPIRRFRLIAAGVLPVSVAYIMAVVLIIGSVAVSWFVSEGPGLAIVVAVCIVLQLGCCFNLKHQPVTDIVLVPSGFMLRAMAGGVAANINLLQWLLLVVAFGSLFMTAGKHYAELLLAERTGKRIRKSLQGCTVIHLRFMWTLAVTVMVLSYVLWGFEMGHTPGTSSTSVIRYEISMVPFTVAILRSAADADRGDTGSPDGIVLKDRPLQALAVLWLLFIVIAVYAVPVLGQFSVLFPLGELWFPSASRRFRGGFGWQLKAHASRGAWAFLYLVSTQIVFGVLVGVSQVSQSVLCGNRGRITIL